MFDTKNFKDSLVEGNIGEFVVWNFFTKLQGIRQVVDVRADKRFQEYDVDFLMEQNDRQYIWVEVKTDFYSDETGNIVYETETLGKKDALPRLKRITLLITLPIADAYTLLMFLQYGSTSNPTIRRNTLSAIKIKGTYSPLKNLESMEFLKRYITQRG